MTNPKMFCLHGSAPYHMFAPEVDTHKISLIIFLSGEELTSYYASVIFLTTLA